MVVVVVVVVVEAGLVSLISAGTNPNIVHNTYVKTKDELLSLITFPPKRLCKAFHYGT